MSLQRRLRNFKLLTFSSLPLSLPPSLPPSLPLSGLPTNPEVLPPKNISPLTVFFVTKAWTPLTSVNFIRYEEEREGGREGGTWRLRAER